MFRGICCCWDWPVEMRNIPIGSFFAKGTGESQKFNVFTGTELFLQAEPSQEAYVRRYLNFSDSNVSDQRFMELTLHWFSGRCVYCAGLSNLLLTCEL